MLDPLAFVAARLPTLRSDSVWATPFLEWAECASLIRRGDAGDEPPTRAEWWRALAAATRLPLAGIGAGGDSLRAALAGAGLLPDSAAGDPGAPPEWSEVARDLEAAREFGWRLPPSPLGEAMRRPHCMRELGVASPGSDPAALSRADLGPPTRARLSLLLADAAGDTPAGSGARPARGSRPAP